MDARRESTKFYHGADSYFPDQSLSESSESSQASVNKDTTIKPRRASAFLEWDLSSASENERNTTISTRVKPGKTVRLLDSQEIREAPDHDDDGASEIDGLDLPAPQVGLDEDVPPTLASRRPFSSMPRIAFFSLLLALLLPLLHQSPILGGVAPAIGVDAGLIRRPIEERDVEVSKRANSPTDICTRWAMASALVNGTIYLYGGQATTQPGQTTNTWNNNFLKLDLSKTWDITTPTIEGLPQPSGPPAVAEAFLWNSYTSLFLYGGEYSDKPVAYPTPYSLWEYNIGSATWIQHQNPKTSAGTNSDGGNQPVGQAAEGGGVSVPSLGRGFYFGGHQDGYTTSGWSQQIARVYLKSMLEFTFPGYSNNAVQSLSGGQTAGPDGVWRNITSGGIQDTAGFAQRADDVLVYVPGYGQQGILLGLAGGTDATFTEMNIIDVYDIASSTWYQQATNGTAPSIRVAPCAVAASAADGSSTNVYMFGGENLPFGSQQQMNDMWILTIPSFTWIQVDQSGQSVPPARAGHTCNIWDGQIIMVGGYVGANISCESPGVFVFDASQLKWQNQFTALGGADTQNQQSSQSGNSTGLSGSYGYQVPGAVQSIIGGAGTGGATVTAPARTATDGPLATGKPITYTVTQTNGATVTETSTSGGGGGSGNGSSGSSGPNIGAIVAGVVAGVFAILAGYLGFCAWVYKRQLALYKNHVAMSQRAAAAGGANEKTGFLYNRSSNEASSGAGKRSTDRSSRAGASGAGNSSSNQSSGVNPPLPGFAVQPPLGGNSTTNSSVEDLVAGQEPTFVGVLLNPRRSLRVINRD